MEGVVHGHTHALLALAHAEGAAQFHFLTKLMLGDKALKLRYDLTRALDVAGATDANCDFQHTDYLSIVE